jgi:hypothetical protein
MQSTRHFCEILVKLKFSQYIFEKYPSVKFRETDEANIRLSQFHRSA